MEFSLSVGYDIDIENFIVIGYAMVIVIELWNFHCQWVMKLISTISLSLVMEFSMSVSYVIIIDNFIVIGCGIFIVIVIRL